MSAPWLQLYRADRGGNFWRAKVARLRDAGAYLGKTIPKSNHDAPVTTAVEFLTLAAEHGGPVAFAHIVTLRAINRNLERVFDPDRKETHWPRRQMNREACWKMMLSTNGGMG